MKAAEGAGLEPAIGATDHRFQGGLTLLCRTLLVPSEGLEPPPPTYQIGVLPLAPRGLAEDEGLEPPHVLSVYSLANCCLTTRPIFLATPTGFEPVISALTGRRVRPNYTKGPGGGGGIRTTRPAGYEPAELTTAPLRLVVLEGLEPPAHSL